MFLTVWIASIKIFTRSSVKCRRNLWTLFRHILGIYEVPTKCQTWQQKQGVETWIRGNISLWGVQEGSQRDRSEGVFVCAWIWSGRDGQSAFPAEARVLAQAQKGLKRRGKSLNAYNTGGTDVRKCRKPQAAREQAKMHMCLSACLWQPPPTPLSSHWLKQVTGCAQI